MRARLQIDVQRRSARLLAGLFDGEYLRVLYAIVGVETLAYNVVTIVDQHCADVWVRRRNAEALLREFQCMSEKKVVGFV
jgi:hypothetical protein